MKMKRRAFLAGTFAAGASLALMGCSPEGGVVIPQSLGKAVTPEAERPTTEPTPVPAQSAYLAVARGNSPEAITMRAIAAIGGIERFVKQGYDVIIKPNICNAHNGPEYASTTNPEVVATLVKLCLGAGARRVRVMDYPFSGSGEAAYVKSGIEAAVKAAGGEMEVMAPAKFVEAEIPAGVDLKKWRFYRPILEADLVINVPIAKHHSLARLTLAGKNLMGTIQDRGSLHRNLGQRIADITSRVRPQLTVVDAVRILMANGPTGGNLNDVKQANTVIASHDIVAADAYATSLFGLKPQDIAYIAASAQMGLGTMELGSVKIEELSV
ncbi:MAG: DUF362 domain-containing protein [Chloroflexi bacterium]|nr:DUF362 domain-containing protein [Chloroflexota bacterium]